MNRLASTEAIAAQIEVRELKRERGWLLRGYWLCRLCGLVTLPVGDDQNRCCFCGGLLTPQEFVRPLEL